MTKIYTFLPFVLAPAPSALMSVNGRYGAKAETEGIPLEVVTVKKPGKHQNELPLDKCVLNFPSGSKY